MVVSLSNAEELARFLVSASPQCVVVDARPRVDYELGHIPGALSFAWEEWCALPPDACGSILHEPGYWGVLGDPLIHGFEERLSRAGIANDTPVVVYADGKKSKGREGRVAWMLLYLGVESVSMLDGGWSGWLHFGGAVESSFHPDTSDESLEGASDCPPPGDRRFHLNLQEHRRCRLETLRSMHDQGSMPLMIDTRSPEEFAGRCYDYQPRKGRLPGSALFHFDSLFDANDKFISRSDYRSRLPVEVTSATSLVAYCEVGVRASTFALLHEIYTGQVVPVFDGSIMQWALEAELPVGCDV